MLSNLMAKLLDLDPLATLKNINLHQCSQVTIRPIKPSLLRMHCQQNLAIIDNAISEGFIDETNCWCTKVLTRAVAVCSWNV
jgi:hypothetical protein